MGKTKKNNGSTGVMKWVKTGLKASTHVFTIGGVIVATVPLHRGLKAAAEGNLQEAGAAIAGDTAGVNPGVVGSFSFKQVTATAVLMALGIGLVAGGAVLRRRIGR